MKARLLASHRKLKPKAVLHRFFSEARCLSSAQQILFVRVLTFASRVKTVCPSGACFAQQGRLVQQRSWEVIRVRLFSRSSPAKQPLRSFLQLPLGLLKSVPSEFRWIPVPAAKTSRRYLSTSDRDAYLFRVAVLWTAMPICRKQIGIAVRVADEAEEKASFIFCKNDCVAEMLCISTTTTTLFEKVHAASA